MLVAVPQLIGRIDEKFAEWEIDVKLWEAEYKEDDRARLGSRLYRRGLHGQPKIIVKTKLGTQDVSQFTVEKIIQCLKEMAMENFLKSSDKRHWITTSTGGKHPGLYSLKNSHCCSEQGYSS